MGWRQGAQRLGLWQGHGLPLGPCWARLGPSWAQVGPMLAYVGLCEPYLGPCWPPYVGLCWGYVGPMLAHLGAYVEAMLAICETISVERLQDANFSFPDPSAEPKTTKKPLNFSGHGVNRGWVSGRVRSAYNLRLPRKASGNEGATALCRRPAKEHYRDSRRDEKLTRA